MVFAKTKNKNYNKRGQITLLITVIVLGAILLIGVNLTMITIKEIGMARTVTESAQAFFAADSGMEYFLYAKKKGIELPSECVGIGDGEFCLDASDEIKAVGKTKGKRRSIRIINDWAKVYMFPSPSVIIDGKRIPGGYRLFAKTGNYLVIFDIDREGDRQNIMGFWKDNYETVLNTENSRGEIIGIPGDEKGEYIGGSGCDGGCDGGYSRLDIFAMKLNFSEGKREIKWQKSLGREGKENLDRMRQMKLAPDGGLILVGETESWGEKKENILVVKLNEKDGSLDKTSDGITEWAFVFGGDKIDKGISVLAEESGYALAGYTNSFGGDKDIFILKLGKDGELKWAKTYDLGGDEEMSIMNSTSDGGYIICGWTKDGPKKKGLVLKLDKNGDKEWAAKCGSLDGEDVEITGIEESLGGGYMGTGSLFSSKDEAIWFAKFDNNGSQKWASQFKSNGEDAVASMSENYALDGGYFLVGSTDSGDFLGEDGKSKGLFLKVSKSGLIYNCDYPESYSKECNLGDTISVDDITENIKKEKCEGIQVTDAYFETNYNLGASEGKICPDSKTRWAETR